ncbi:MAG: hypothetical protein PHF55_05725 [Bacteroidales bacterium]|nr:hypothetical protein [Bacteroidales bacterium]
MTWQLIKRANIDENKWNHTVDNSSNHHISGLSWYLDIVAPNWHGLVWNDYEIVFPFTKKKKYFIPYFMQPPMITHLRLYSLISINKDIFLSLLETIKKNVLYADFYLEDIEFANDFKKLDRYNYILDLNDITDLHDVLSSHHLRKIKKFEKLNYQFIHLTNISEYFLDDYLCNSKYLIKLKNIRKIIIELGKCFENRQSGGWWAIKQNDEILSIALISEYQNKLVLHAFASNEIGKKQGAMHFLIYQIIKQAQNNGINIIDFDGGNNYKMAFFYEGFGGKPYKYVELIIKQFSF